MRHRTNETLLIAHSVHVELRTKILFTFFSTAPRTQLMATLNSLIDNAPPLANLNDAGLIDSKLLARLYFGPKRMLLFLVAKWTARCPRSAS